MRIVIEQPASVDDHNWDLAGVQSPASVTIDLDSGDRIEFTAHPRSLLDLNPGGPDYPEADFTQHGLRLAVREPGIFQLTMERVRDVEFSRTPVCPFTQSHTREVCGYEGCRES